MQLCHSGRRRRTVSPLCTCRPAGFTLHTARRSRGPRRPGRDRVIELRAIVASTVAAARRRSPACNGDAELQARARAGAPRRRERDQRREHLRPVPQPQRRRPPGARSTATSGRPRSTCCRSCRSRAPTPSRALLVTGWGNVGGDGGAYRVTVYISDPALDARALKVAGFRQAGGRAVPVGEAENRALEDAILTRARQMRIAEAERAAATETGEPCRATTPARSSRSGRRPGTRPGCSAPSATRRGRSSTCSRCSPIRRGASTWGTCATTRWATSIARYKRGARLQRAAPDGLGRLRHAGRERRDREGRAARRAGPTRTSRRCGRR